MSVSRAAACVIALLVAGLVTASVALACASYVTFGDGPPTSDGPPSYPPGETVTMKGFDFDSEAVTPVTVHWGGDTGPIVAEAPIADDGTWTVSFPIPASAEPDQTYRLSLQARGADGQMAEALPLQTAVRVVTPGAEAGSGARVDEPTADSGSIQRTRGGEQRRAAPPQRHVHVGDGAPAPSDAAPAAAPVIRTPVRDAPGTSAAPRTRPADAEPVPSPARATGARVAAPGPVEVAPERLSPAPPAVTPLRVPAWGGSEPSPFAVAAIVLFALLASAGGATALASRQPPRSPLPPRHDEVASADVEAALQELIAEERARMLERPEADERSEPAVRA